VQVHSPEREGRAAEMGRTGWEVTEERKKETERGNEKERENVNEKENVRGNEIEAIRPAEYVGAVVQEAALQWGKFCTVC
jgi:hypothetical protein